MDHINLDSFFDELEKIAAGLGGFLGKLKDKAAPALETAAAKTKEWGGIAEEAAAKHQAKATKGLRGVGDDMYAGAAERYEPIEILTPRRKLSPEDITPAMKAMADKHGIDLNEVIVKGGPIPFPFRGGLPWTMGLNQPHYLSPSHRVVTTEGPTPKLVNRAAKALGRKTPLVGEGPSEAITMHEIGHAAGSPRHPLVRAARDMAVQGKTHGKAQAAAEKGKKLKAQLWEGAGQADTLYEEARATKLALEHIGAQYGKNSPQYKRALAQLGPAYATYLLGAKQGIRGVGQVADAANKKKPGMVERGTKKVLKGLKEQADKGNA